MREIQETWVGFLGRGMIPWRRKWQPAPVFLPGTFRGQRSLVDYKSPRGPRVRHDRAHVHAWLGGHQVSVLGQGSGRHCTNLWSSYSESCPLSAESLYLVPSLSPQASCKPAGFPALSHHRPVLWKSSDHETVGEKAAKPGNCLLPVPLPRWCYLGHQW